MDVIRRVVTTQFLLRNIRNNTHHHPRRGVISSHPGLYSLHPRPKKSSVGVVSRKLHSCCILNQQNKLTETKIKENEEGLSKNADNSDMEPHVIGEEVSVRRSKLDVPQVKEPEEPDMLPDHDPQRITPESRRLVQKAGFMFDDLAAERGATKEVFQFAAQKYVSKEALYRRGAVEFIYAGLHNMKKFGVERDLDCYKALLQAFPEGKLIPRNAWQVEFMHYPRQQQCGIDLLEKMEMNAVIPDRDFGRLLQNRFGTEAHVTRKYRRMMYWLPKFKNMNPYPIPFDMPDDSIERALIALKRMSVDKETEYKVWKTADMMENPEEDTFIASAQSRTQRRLLQEHDKESPLFVEGPYNVFLRFLKQSYFLLRAEPNINALMKQKQLQKEEEEDEHLFEWKNFFDEEHYTELYPVLSVHEQDDSTILGLCITGTSTKSSVVNWIRCLERDNPNLGQTPILFQLRDVTDSEVVTIGDNRQFKDES